MVDDAHRRDEGGFRLWLKDKFVSGLHSVGGVMRRVESRLKPGRAEPQVAADAAVWNRLLAQEGFREALKKGNQDIDDGRGTTLTEAPRRR